ncbi:DUF625-domain-containing protein [Suhomyces tanzawaensis NRRL Y-17324]|uniref:DUF625-domain-containing protein n=1 Tax=Suhomyces tanzawaensis NRRL Y-17324 TaxID=984487 RepID=A0A1E4SJ20_9ASCO|nr:DUF625-domain-containing protein [Suhomyces tanzawaensis NRRL Y-17324]ODV79506.1 DUF625-domain-containing protein [Suhomyces tanzawaensis NRRL Y-17324]
MVDFNKDRTTAGQTPRRVKVYLLQGEDWLDNGTGYCVGEVDETSNMPFFLVRNELDSGDVILKSFLEGSTQYQRQQETLIVWTDSSGKDLALSFQETEGCADLCDFIIKVQQDKLCPDISLYYVIPSMSDGDDITELITGPINYPEDPTMDNLDTILDLINQNSNSQFSRTSILNYIIENDYFSKLIQAFDEAESSKRLPHLYTLSEIMKTLVLFNEASLIEEFLSTEEKILGLVGILEYDPEYPNFKACHRDYLKNKSFKTVIPVDKVGIFKKDYHFNFLKDVVLARFLDDQTFNLLSSLIYVNQVEIINYLKDASLLEKLFEIYDESEHCNEQQLTLKRDGVKMLHQYVLIARSLQTHQKSNFFSFLVKGGLFRMISFALQDADSKVRVFGTELIVIIIEQDVSLVSAIDNEETIDNSDPPLNPVIEEDKDDTIVEPKNLKLKLSDDMTLISILTKLLVEDRNPGLKVQAFEALRILLDSNIASNGGNNSDFEMENPRNEFSSKDSAHCNGSLITDEFNDINTNNYFKAFYSQVAPELFKNLIELASVDQIANKDEISTQIRHDVLLYQQLCELISFCTKEHEVQISRPFFIENNIILGLGKLLDTNCKLILKLSIVRCLKNLILLNDDFYCRYILNSDILGYFFRFFELIVDQNNLANSACVDFVDNILRNCDANISIKRHNFKLIANYIYKNFRQFCGTRLAYVNTGRELIDLVENGFYEDSLQNGKFDDGFVDEILEEHDVLTPINEDATNNPTPVDNSSDVSPDTSPQGSPTVFAGLQVADLEHVNSDLAYTTEASGRFGDPEASGRFGDPDSNSPSSSSGMDASDAGFGTPTDLFAGIDSEALRSVGLPKTTEPMGVSKPEPHQGRKKKLTTTIKNKLTSASHKITRTLQNGSNSADSAVPQPPDLTPRTNGGPTSN